MKRRHFVGGLATAAAFSMWPAFLREAFGKGSECAGKDKKEDRKRRSAIGEVAVVASAFRRAAKNKKPLLVFVVPKEGSQYDRGQAFGELLNHGSDEDLAPLADVEVVCAPMKAVRRIVPAVPEGDPLMVLIRADALPATGKHLNADLPTLRGDDRYKDLTANEIIEKRISTLGKLLREGIGDHKHRVKARAQEARKALKEKAPEGTQWANSTGCGITFEGENDEPRVGCGMAFVPEKSRRFLYFYSAT